ncbi:hypothetical protein HAX54_046640 [Datura stramonium]|uniref:Uncharacterized protein n=1 Tax=Datura stramonium TaxID=4076 RepID=A0ABS8WJ98_DATST|nr:hypothetical protein [Datura stramonium]
MTTHFSQLVTFVTKDGSFPGFRNDCSVDDVARRGAIQWSFQTDETILLKMHFVLLEFGEGYFVKGLRSLSDKCLLKRRKLSLFPFH